MLTHHSKHTLVTVQNQHPSTSDTTHTENTDAFHCTGTEEILRSHHTYARYQVTKTGFRNIHQRFTSQRQTKIQMVPNYTEGFKHKFSTHYTHSTQQKTLQDVHGGRPHHSLVLEEIDVKLLKVSKCRVEIDFTSEM